jgi:hypothetical protein
MPKNLSRDAKISKDTIPPVYLQYAATDVEVSTVNGTPATTITIPYVGSQTEYHRYEWNAKKASWDKSIRFFETKQWYKYTTRQDKRVSPPNVLIIFCAWKMGVLKGYKGHKEPIYSIRNGKDKFIYFHDGKYVTGTWEKGERSDRFKFLLDDGTFLKMAPGQTWVEMPQHDAKVKIS